MLKVLCGPARSGKTEQLLKRYRLALSDHPPGSALWIAPSWRAAAEVRNRLLDGRFRGCFAPGVTTFQKFALKVLAQSGREIRQLTRPMKRDLIRQILAQQAKLGRLKYFRAIAASGGLVELVCQWIGELKRLEIWPEHFQEACARYGTTDKDAELFEIYNLYQQALREHGLYDSDGCLWSARDELVRGQGTEVRDQGAGEHAKPQAALIHHSSFIIHHWHYIVLDGFTDFTRTQHEIIECLAQRSDEVVVSLPLEPPPVRTDLFAKPLATLAELSRRHAGIIVEQIDRLPTDWSAMDHLERRLFVNPRDQGSEVGGQGLEEVASGQWRVASEQSKISKSQIPNLQIPKSLTPDPSSFRLEILAAGSQLGEIEMIAGRIKRLLVDGQARPDEVAVVFRQEQEPGGLIDEVFSRAGIPVAFESGGVLAGAPQLRALVALLQLDLDDWPFEQLLSVVGSNYFRPRWPEFHRAGAVAQLDGLIRRLQIPHGRRQLLEQLAAEGENRGEGKGESREGRFKARKSLNSQISKSQNIQIPQSILRRLAAAFDALPQRATLPDWANAWQRLAEETGLITGNDECRMMNDELTLGRNNSSSPFTPSPWTRLIDLLSSGDRLAGWLGTRPPELDRREAVQALRDILATERETVDSDDAGCVRVLSVLNVRALRIPYLFLAGLSEKVFPPPQREDCLYSEVECARLIEAGLPLATRSQQAREEMLLFYEAATRADRRLYLSYPSLDESAQSLLPSPFLSELEEAFAPTCIPLTERTDLSPVPTDDEPISLAEFRIKATATALEGNVALLAGLFIWARGQGPGVREPISRTPNSQFSHPMPLIPCPSLVDNLAAGLELIHQRQDRVNFGPAEGVFIGKAARDYMATRFPQSHIFAATELESYAYCPFRFFLERILHIEPLVDLALEFDVMQRGRVVHDVLAAFHRRVNQQFGRPASPLELDPADYDALLAEAIAESLPAESPNPVLAALQEIDRRLVVEWLGQYRGQLERYAALWKDFQSPMTPELFEASFGRADEPAPSTDRALEFACAGHAVRVSGRIDRVDTGVVAGRPVCNVLDYKTGAGIALSLETVRMGTTLQLPLYALAAVEMLLVDRDVIPWQAGYWYVRDDGYKPRQALRMYRNDDGWIELEPDWEQIRAALDETIISLVENMRRGRFCVACADEQCTGRCPYNTVCRINHLRSLEKTCLPTASE